MQHQTETEARGEQDRKPDPEQLKGQKTAQVTETKTCVHGRGYDRKQN